MNAGGLSLSFAGTPELAAVVLEALLNNTHHRMSRVYTQPDKPVGRGRKIIPGPVKRVAGQYHIPVKQPKSANEIALDDDLRHIDALIVVAYGLILPQAVLSGPRYGCINVHTSLLPRWRGAAPIQRAIQSGDEKTGVSIMLMDAGIDSGDILLQKPCAIHADDTSGTLHARLALLGSECLIDALSKIAQGSARLSAQDETQATYANKISKQEAHIQWGADAAQIARNIRAFNPTPVAYTRINHKKIRIWQAEVLTSNTKNYLPGEVLAYSAAGLDIATGDRALRVLNLQLEGGKQQPVKAFYNGHPKMFTPAGCGMFFR